MKKIYILCCAAVLFFGFACFGSAASFDIYGDISYNSSQAMNLYSYYMNSDGFNPFNDYQIARVSQYEYLLMYTDQTELHYILYNTYGQYTGQVFIEYEVDSFSLNNPNNYTYISNMKDPNAIRSSTIEQYNFQYVCTYLLPIIAVILLFSMFRSNYNPFKRGYDV